MGSTRTQSGFMWTARRIIALTWVSVIFFAALILLIISGVPQQSWYILIGALILALFLDSVAVRDRTRQPLSMVGVVLLALALFQPLSNTLWVAFATGLVIKPPRNLLHWSEFIFRRVLEASARTLTLGLPLLWLAEKPTLLLFSTLFISFVIGIHLIRWIFTWLWEADLRLEGIVMRALVPSLLIEVLPLPLALVGSEIAQKFSIYLTILSGAGLLASGVMIRRSIRSIGIQRRTLAELGQINAISRAIIRAELDVDALCNLIYAEASNVVDTSNFRLGLFSGKTFKLKVRVQDGERQSPLQVQLGQDDGIVGWMRRTGRSLLVYDFETELEQLPARPTYQAEKPPRSGIYIPLFTGDEVIGTISIQSRQSHAFDTEDLRILSLIADQAATAIDKARAYNAARRRAAQLATISEVSRQITAIFDLDRLLPSIVDLIRSSFGYFQVHLFTVDQSTKELVFRASTNPNNPFWLDQGQRLAPGLGIVGQVAQTGELMLVNNVDQEPRFIADQIGIASELVVPFRIGDQLLGVLDVQSEHYAGFDENDIFVLQTLADQIAIAIDSANIFTAQQEEAWVLNALLQSAENIAWVNNVYEALELGVRLPSILLGCTHSICLLWNKDSESWQQAAMWGIAASERGQYDAQHVSPEQLEILSHIRSEGEIHFTTQEEQQALIASQIIPQIEYGAMLALPLTTRGITSGILLLDNQPDKWGKRQVTIATGIAGQIAAAVEGALLAQAETERYHLEQEINLARELQTSLLPRNAPQIGGWNIGSYWQSARQVGGDFFDFWQFTTGPSEGQLGFVIADVSDKGVPAALFMALARSLVRASALDGSSPAEALERANRWIVRDSQASMFVTLFYGILNLETGDLRYSCAGHNPPILYRAKDGTTETLRTPGIALGVLDEIQLNEAQTHIEQQDVLLCYTDGVTESINDELEEWGVERLTTTIKAHSGATADILLHTIMNIMLEHAGELPPFDDVTMVAIKRTHTLTAELTS